MKTTRQKSHWKFKSRMVLELIKVYCSFYDLFKQYQYLPQQHNHWKQYSFHHVIFTNRLKKIFIVAILCIIFAGCTQQEGKKEESNELLPTDRIELNYPNAEVAILGTFHFKSNVDAYKRKYHIDISTEKTQNEIQELLDHLKGFQPTKIALEFPIKNQDKLDSLYQEYRKDNFELPVAEMYQLGFRLAKQLGHPHIYGVDTQAPLHLETRVADWEQYAKETGLQDKWNDFTTYFTEKYTNSDSLKTTMSLLDYYSFLNSKEVELVSGQDKLNGMIQLGAGDTYIGADGITKDYRRNLRIYANMLNLIESDEDRFLMIYGSSHKRILRHFFEDSMEFTYKDISPYLE
ncbi:MAG: DUF5694 domain-containing protein [Bacteroidota bacterium]